MSKTVTLYNGEVTIDFDADKHFYRVVGSQVKPDGVTTILGLVPKYLLPWVAKVTAEHIRAGLFDRMSRGDSITEMSYLEALCNEAKKAHTVKRDTAGDIGTLVHAFAEEVISQGDEWLSVVAGLFEGMPDEAVPGCAAFINWWTVVAPGISECESERIVFSRRLFYCGTCDLFATINGKPTVVDFKTGSGFYEDQPLQLAAYALALEEELGVEINDGWIIHLDKQTGKCTPYHVEITKELKTDWEAVRIAWRAVKRNQTRHKEIKGNQRCQTSATTIQAEAL